MPTIATKTCRCFAWSVAAVTCLYVLPTASGQDRGQEESYQQQGSYSQQFDTEQYDDRTEADRDQRTRFRDRDDRRTRENRRGDRGNDERDENVQNDEYRRSSPRADGSQYGAQHNDQPAGLGVSAATSRRGVRVLRVMQDSPADEAGLQENDEILSVNGTSIDDGRQLTQVIRRQEPGSQVRLRIYRDGQERTLTATLKPLREAIGNRGDQPDGRDRRFYRGSPPWGDDQLIQHVDHLERHIRQLQRELRDLRQMLSDDPGRRGYSQDRDSRRSSNRDERFQDDDRRSGDDDRFYEDRDDSRRSR